MKNIIVGNKYKKNKWWLKKIMNEKNNKWDGEDDRESVEKCIWKSR